MYTYSFNAMIEKIQIMLVIYNNIIKNTILHYKCIVLNLHYWQGT